MVSRRTIFSKLNYNEETGELTWKYSRGRAVKGKIAGWIIGKRRYVRIDGGDYPVTSIIWMYCYGKWPKKKILLKDGNPSNLKLANLRDPGIKSRPDQKRIKQLLKYDPNTGIFKWKKIGRNAGKVAGCYNYYGYKVIGIDGARYQASVLAWVYMEGYWPEHQIDHKNRDKSDNRWCNLRHVTSSCNNRNKGRNKNNKSGVTGVSRNKRNMRWYVDIGNKHHSSYEKFDDAIMARWKAEKANGYHNCQSTSSAYLYLKEKGII